MKVKDKEINIFESDTEINEIFRQNKQLAQIHGKGNIGKEQPMTLHRFANIYFEIKKQFYDGTIKLPYHERNFQKVLKDKYEIEVSIDEMMELRDYFDNYYSNEIRDKILDDFTLGMRKG